MNTLTVLLLCHMRLYISCKLGRRWYLTAVQAEFRVRGCAGRTVFSAARLFGDRTLYTNVYRILQRVVFVCPLPVGTRAERKHGLEWGSAAQDTNIHPEGYSVLFQRWMQNAKLDKCLSLCMQAVYIVSNCFDTTAWNSRNMVAYFLTVVSPFYEHFKARVQGLCWS